MRRRVSIMLSTVAVAVTAAFAFGPAAPTGPQATEAAAAGPRCELVTVPVAITAGAPASSRISGTLCLPRRDAPTAIQVLVPGGTYGKAYWTLRPGAHRKSYVEHMLGAGFATLAIDRLGSGSSSTPPSAAYQTDTQQAVLHQVLRSVRAGIRGHHFEKITVAGHSFGSTLARTIAIHHPEDVDALVLTSEASRAVELPWEQVIHPAPADPVLAGRGHDEGYYTTQPGVRGTWFYAPAAADRWVIAVDELTKQADVFSNAYPMPEENAAIRVPVMMVVGAADRIVCAPGGSDCSTDATLYAQEKPFYPNAELRTEVVAGTGHALNLHRTAPAWHRQVSAWLNKYAR